MGIGKEQCTQQPIVPLLLGMMSVRGYLKNGLAYAFKVVKSYMQTNGGLHTAGPRRTFNTHSAR